MKTKIAVISDIHANADALTTVIEDLKMKSVDITIFLGDILTYGCQPIEVMSILNKYKKENSAILLKYLWSSRASRRKAMQARFQTVAIS